MWNMGILMMMNDPTWDRMIQLELRRKKERERLLSSKDKLVQGGLGYFRKRYLANIVENYYWYKLIDDFIMEHDYILIIVPPGWGKTYGVSIPFPLFKLCQDRTVKGLMVSKSAGLASAFMQSAKHQLRENEDMHRDFGGTFYDKNLTWTDTKLKVVGYNPAQHTPSLLSLGLLGQAEGYRPNYIVLDDPIDKETAYSPTGIKHFLDTLNETLNSRIEPPFKNPHFKLIIVTHRFCETDGLDKLMNDERFKPGTLIIPAIQGKGPKNQAHIPGIKIGGSTCPERFPDEINGDRYARGTIQWWKDHIKSYIWNAQYLARPSGRGDNPFNFDWIAPPKVIEYRADGITPSKWLHKRNACKWVDVYPTHTDVFIDPAYKSEEKFDYNGIIGIGPHPTDPHGLILCFLAHPRISSGFSEKYRDYFRNLGPRYNARMIQIEINNARTAGDNLRSIGVPVEDIIASRDKSFRIGELELLFKFRPDQALENGEYRLYFHNNLREQTQVNDDGEIVYVWETFCDEYKNWSADSKSHDHLLDALSSYFLWNYRQNVQYGGEIFIG